MIFPQVSEILMRHVGWRWTYVTLGAMVFVTMAVVGGVLFRERPEQLGSPRMLVAWRHDVARTRSRCSPARKPCGR
jgi:sugar phosphate permease